MSDEQSTERLEALVTALSNRVDQIERDKIVLQVMDGRKVAMADERHAEFGRHADDIMPHSYRDYVDDRDMPRIKEETAGGGAAAVVAASACLRSGGIYIPSGSGVASMGSAILGHDKNADILDADAPNNKIIVKRSGIYDVKLQCEILLTLNKASTLTQSILAYVKIDGVKSDIIYRLRSDSSALDINVGLLGVEGSASTDILIDLGSKQSIDIEVEAEYANISGALDSVNRIRLSMSYVCDP